MRITGLKLVVAATLVASLGACVPEAALIEAGVAQPPAAQLVPDAYVARADSGIAIPALPTEQIPQQFQRQTVYFPTDQPTGTIVIDPAQKHLHLVTGNNRAIRYGIAVGRAGFEWSGEAVVTEKKPWPTWTPPKEMIARDPKLAKWENGQPGGPSNPLGARAIYLTTNGVDYGYRIHGTPEWKSIGRNASSGCIRMINQDVIDLYGRLQGGEKVVVLTASGEMPSGLTLPPRAPAPARSVPVAAPAAPEVPAPILVPMPAVMPVPVVTGPLAAAVIPTSP
jgi:lipoprotein-anchoring transpeptidase ErfK/SrfK